MYLSGRFNDSVFTLMKLPLNNNHFLMSQLFCFEELVCIMTNQMEISTAYKIVQY